MRKLHILTLLFLIVPLFGWAQISEGGIPPSFSNPIQLRTLKSTYQVPIDFDVDRLIWEDSIAESNHATTRIAIGIPVDIDIKTSGDWTTLSDSTRIWQQTISAEGAQGMILSYKKFYIPEGGKLFIYNQDKTQLLGAYTSKTNPRGSAFATEAIFGNTITLEYVASEISLEQPQIVIEDVGYIYKSDITLRSQPIINGSLDCMININCSQGLNWQKQKRGVVMLALRYHMIGPYYAWNACTGSLVNNTAQDGKPLLLTASHCYISPELANQTILYFNYEFETCRNGTTMPDYKTQTGTNILVNIPLQDGGDAVLAEVSGGVPESWHPYYNGWDVRSTAATSGSVIHHPNWDVKKIVIYNKPISSTTYKDNKGNVSASNAEWAVVYNGQSVTQGGSSGAPLFNQNGLIVGTLTGGATDCDHLYNSDYYGKFWYNWDRYVSSNGTALKLSTYLDPLNKSVQTLTGFDPNPPTGIEDEEVFEGKDFILFPNPVEADLSINTKAIIQTIYIYDLSGKMVYANKDTNSSTLTIPVSSWANGVYTVKVNTELGTYTDKFIKK